MDRQVQQSGQGVVRRLAVLLGSAALLLPLAEPVGPRTGAVARVLLAMAATAMATPAQAQTTTTLVNNSDGGLVSSGSTNRHAQAFTTGTAANSYTVTRVQVRFASVSSSTSASAVIREDDGGQPGALVATLVNPGSFTSGSNTFTAPENTVLEPGTTYWLSIHEGVDPRFVVRVTTRNTETGLPGWSIADNHLEREEDDDIWEPGDTTVAMKVVGYANTNDAPTVANPIADQTVTVGETLSFAFPDTTFEDTDTDDTLTYTALLDDGSALPGWLTFDVDNRHFEGTPQAGDGGAITVRVTADDGTATVHDDFDIRVGTTCPAPTFGTRRQIWTGTVTVEFAPDGPNAGFYGFEDGGQGVLDDETFNIGANDYTITRVTVATGGELDDILAFSLQTNNVLMSDKEKGNLRLHVCDMPYNFDDATLVAGRRYEWSTSGLDWSGESTRTLYLSLPANTPVTGTPTISSDAAAGATVGDTLTAEQGDIDDSDGLPTSTFPEGYTIQWVREDEDGMNEENITGQTSQTYTLTEDDVDKKVQVRVRFTDQLGTMETVTSAAFPASGTVIGPGVSVTPTSVSTDEGEMATYTLQLNTQPAGAVTITPSSDDSGVVSVAPASVVFTTANWDTAQMVTVTAEQDDNTTSETVTISHSVSGYDTLTTADPVTVTVVDDDAAGVNVTPTSVSTDEGETATYTLQLNTQPAGAVTITPSSDDSGVVSVVPASVVFTTANWDTAQTVTVTAEQDDNTMNETVTISHSVSGYGPALTTADPVTVTVVDDDAAGVNITPTSVSTDEGEMATYTLQLNTQPAGAVTITPSSDDSGVVSVVPASVVFTTANWDTAQMVTVTAEQDDNTTSETVTISHRVSGYDTLTTADPVTVTVVDDDAAGVNVTPTSVSTDEGETATYTLQLNTQPAGPVTITPSSSGDSGVVSVAPASVVFTTATWDTAQTVTVTAEQDDNTMNETVTISHRVSGYGPAITTADPVTVAVTDTTTDATDKDEEAEVVLDVVVLPRLIQQLTAQTTEIITSRLNTIATESPSTSVAISLEEGLADAVAALHGQWDHLKNGSLEWQQAFSGADFAFPLSGLVLAQGEGASAQDHPFSSLAVWGGGNTSSYGNIIENTDMDGGGFSGVIGMDMQPTPQLVTGLTLTTSRWGLDYATAASEEGAYTLGVTMVNPYLNWLATDQLSLWGTFGYGRGEVEKNPAGDAPVTSADSFTSWAGGARFEVLAGGDPLTGVRSPFGLAFKLDAATASFLDIRVQLARLAAEISRSVPLETGLLTAAVDLGWTIRSVSHQDNQTDLEQRIAEKNDGGGAELAGSLHWLSADGSVSATVEPRVLLGGGDHREWGMGGQLRFTPSRRDGEGLNLTLQPSFGVTDTRLEELWSLSGDGDPAINNDPPGARLEAELAYGFRHGNALLTPYTEMTWEETASTYRAGLRYGLNPFLDLDLKGVHRRRANGNHENRLLLEVDSDL